jgi:hypothetical protein
MIWTTCQAFTAGRELISENVTVSYKCIDEIRYYSTTINIATLHLVESQHETISRAITALLIARQTALNGTLI